jgi:hypothetical protein
MLKFVILRFVSLVCVVSTLSIVQSIFIMRSGEKTFVFKKFRFRKLKIDPEKSSVTDCHKQEADHWEYQAAIFLKIVDRIFFTIVFCLITGMILYMQMTFTGQYPEMPVAENYVAPHTNST